MRLLKSALLGALLATLAAFGADAQTVSSGKVTTAAPTYVSGTAGALSLDTSGNLRTTASVSITPGTAFVSDGHTTTAAPTYVNGTDNPLSLDLAGGLRVNCTAGCSGAGNSNAQATTAAPTYVNNTSNALSQDLSGNLRVLIGNTSIPVTNTGTFAVQASQATAANLNATVVGTGTFATQGTDTVTGNVASGAADSGNPVKAGCVFNTTLPTVTTGQRVDCQASNRGMQFVTLGSGAGAVGVGSTAADGQTNSSTALSVYAAPMLFNGTNSDRARGDASSPGIAQVEIAPTATNASAITPVVSASVETGHVLKASAGNLYAVYVTTGAAAGFLMTFNSTTVPAAGAVTPVDCVPVAANSSVSIAYLDVPEAFSTGISAAFSTTGCFTKTDSATAFIHGNVK